MEEVISTIHANRFYFVFFFVVAVFFYHLPAWLVNGWYLAVDRNLKETYSSYLHLLSHNIDYIVTHFIVLNLQTD